MATEKKNVNRRAEREKARRMEKIELLLWKIGIGVVVVAFFVIVGVTCVNMFKDYQASKPNYDNTEMAVSDLVGVLQATEAAAEEADGDLVIEPVVDAAESEAESAEGESAESAEEAEAVSEDAESAEDQESAGEAENTEAAESEAAAEEAKDDASQAADGGESEGTEGN